MTFKILAALFVLAQTVYFVLEIRRLRQEMYDSQEGLWRGVDIALSHILHHQNPDYEKMLELIHQHVEYLKGKER